MKLRPIALLGLTIFVIPGIAPAQNAVTEWNNIAVKTELAGNSAIPANSPNGMALYLAYVHLAIHDAVNAIEHRYKPFGMPIEVPAGASVDAAVGRLTAWRPGWLQRISSLLCELAMGMAPRCRTSTPTCHFAGHLAHNANARHMDSDSANSAGPSEHSAGLSDHAMDGPNDAVHDAQCLSVPSRAAALPLELGMGARLQPGEDFGRDE